MSMAPEHRPRRPFGEYITVVAIAALVTTGLHFVLPQRPSAGTASSIYGTAEPVSVYERVMRSGTIRCAYATYPPSCIKDPNTGKLSGVFVEIVERVAKDLDLKVEWVEEVGWGTMIEGLRANRYDLMASGVWANSTRGKLADFTVPLYFNGIGVYVRPGERRFSANLQRINTPEIRIATIDGEISDLLSRQMFPKAQRVSLPQLSDNSQMMLNVVQGRADVTFAEAQAGRQFLRGNSSALENIAAEKPIRIFPAVMMFKKDQSSFKSMLDTALQELINSGFIEEVIRRYAQDPRDFYPVAYPYRPMSLEKGDRNGP